MRAEGESNGSGIQTAIHSLAEWSAFAPVWEQLLEEDAGYSVFLTVPWIETWFETFGDVLDISLLVFGAAHQPEGAGLVVASRASLSRPLRRMSINASGERNADTTYVEFNDVLSRQGWESAVGQALARYVLQQPWEEFALDGFCPGPCLDEMKRLLSGAQAEEIWRPSYYIDLDALRVTGDPYLNVLGPRHRKHLPQNLRYHAEHGELFLKAASRRPWRSTCSRSWRPSIDAGVRVSGSSSVVQLRTIPRVSSQIYPAHVRDRQCAIAAGYIRSQHGRSDLRTSVHRGKVYFYQCGYN